jgi:DNA invertase Pin-like site-specific DNA recombinase
LQIKAAIYSRKSVLTGKGDSIENQINLCKDYAEKYIQGIDEFLLYEDEGFSGGNTKRPQYQRMLEDAKHNMFDMIIVYRLDRISRNVADFSATLELLQNNNIAFISIREQFDTSTPMGKAMIYIASVFAQLERETIAERIRDNMLELAKSGRWLGGQCPLGFESEKITIIDEDYTEKFLFKLKPLEDELNLVKLIYDKYYETCSVHKVLKYLLANNIKGKNGGDFASMTISDILRNPVYVSSDKAVLDYLGEQGMQTCGEGDGHGILIYNKKNSKSKYHDVSEWVAAVSKHKGVIPSDKWLHIQNILDNNVKKVSPRQGTSKTSLLSGILKCAHCGAPMRVTYGRYNITTCKRLYYYTCTMKAHSGKSRCNNPNVRGDFIEEQILCQLLEFNTPMIIRELEAAIQSKKLPEEISLKNSLMKNLEMKRKELDILITQLANFNNSPAQSFIIQKIDALASEIKEMEIQFVNTKVGNTELVPFDYLSLINAFSSFEDLFKQIDLLVKDEEAISKKRYLLESVINKITYDGETKTIVIYLWGT